MIWLSLFWASCAFLFYVLAGYPLMLWALSLVRSRPHKRETIWPAVSIIIPALDEERTIAGKIRNTLALSYPQGEREIIVVSDGCVDGTADIVRGFADQGVKLLELPERRGKHYGQMLAKDMARGEILVFTDAAVELDEGALQNIVSNFADVSVGCVSSEDRVAGKAGGEAWYVRIEMWLRRVEAQVGSLVGVSGSFFAARRDLCAKWHPSQSSDFFLPLHTVAAGFRSVVDPNSHATYGVTRSSRSELQRKIRTIVHGLDVFFSHLEMLNPLRYGLFAVQLVSHKLFRWLIPFAGLTLLLSNCFLWDAGVFYRVTLMAQAAVYVGGLIAIALAKFVQNRAVKLASFILLGNAATIIAWLKFCSGERFINWQPTRRE
jgi:cellulose synthase/poly-beta-1,6-N-acetylglucosamine synthase-like glycosyltransferase